MAEMAYIILVSRRARRQRLRGDRDQAVDIDWGLSWRRSERWTLARSRSFGRNGRFQL